MAHIADVAMIPDEHARSTAANSPGVQLRSVLGPQPQRLCTEPVVRWLCGKFTIWEVDEAAFHQHRRGKDDEPCENSRERDASGYVEDGGHCGTFPLFRLLYYSTVEIEEQDAPERSDVILLHYLRSAR